MDRKLFYKVSFGKMKQLLSEHGASPDSTNRTKNDDMLIFELKNLNPDQIKDLCDILDVAPVIASECSMIHSVDKLDIFGSRSFIIHASIIVSPLHPQ